MDRPALGVDDAEPRTGRILEGKRRTGREGEDEELGGGIDLGE